MYVHIATSMDKHTNTQTQTIHKSTLYGNLAAFKISARFSDGMACCRDFCDGDACGIPPTLPDKFIIDPEGEARLERTLDIIDPYPSPLPGPAGD